MLQLLTPLWSIADRMTDIVRWNGMENSHLLKDI